MLKEKINNIKNLFIKKSEGNNKKTIENLVVFIILLIITIFAINIIWGKDEKNKSEQSSSLLAKDINEIDMKSNMVQVNEYNLKEELESILSKMQGIGKIKVLITYSETGSVVAMYNETESSSKTDETDSNGGTRTVQVTDSVKEIIKDGQNIPITQKVVMPKIEGAIIIAEGGGNAVLKTNIIQAVSAVTGLATYKVQVFEMN